MLSSALFDKHKGVFELHGCCCGFVFLKKSPRQDTAHRSESATVNVFTQQALSTGPFHMDETAEPLFTDIGAIRYQDTFVIPHQLRSVQTLLRDLPPKSRVLDVGCGTGRPVGEALSKAGHDFTGVDVTPDMVETARKQLPRSEIHLSDERTWEPSEKDLPFDCVVSYYAFLISVSNDDTRAFFPQAYSWLRPGGIFVFGTVVFEGEKQQLKWLGRDVVSSSLGSEDLRQEIRKAGFVIESEESAPFSPEKAVGTGLCREEDVWEEDQLILHCRKLE